MPASLEMRGAALVLLVAVSIGVPAFLSFRILSRRQAQRSASSAEALLAVALRAYLDAAPETSAECGEWLARLSEQEQRVRWAGVFDRERNGLEFLRQTNLRREEIIEQIPFDADEPVSQHLVVRGTPSRRFMLLAVPEPASGATLAAVVDLGDGSPGDGPLIIAGLVCLGAAGLAAALAWFHYAVQRPVKSLDCWVAAWQHGLSPTSLEHGLPDEFHRLVCSVKQTQGELQKWRSEAGQLRHSLEAQLDAKTKRMTRQLNRAVHDADTDPLTKLGNRRALESRLPQLFAEEQAAGRELTAVWFDVDHFKNINDALGHQLGDEVLAFLGQLLATTIRESTDLAVRYGGDEFVLLLRDTSAAGALDVATRVRNLFRQRASLLDGVEPRPALSAGVAAMQQHRVHSWEALLELADQAMYYAKQHGLGVATASDTKAAKGA